MSNAPDSVGSIAVPTAPAILACKKRLRDGGVLEAGIFVLGKVFSLIPGELGSGIIARKCGRERHARARVGTDPRGDSRFRRSRRALLASSSMKHQLTK